MNIVINEGLKAYIDPLTPDEHEALESRLLAEGCRDALVLWGDVLVDEPGEPGQNSVMALKARIEELESENVKLRAQVLALPG